MFEKSIKLIDIQTIVVSLIILAVCLLRVAPHINNFSPIIALAIFGSLHFKNKTQAYVVPILCLWVSDYFINNFIYILSNNQVWFYEGFYWQYISYFVIILLSLSFKNKKISFKSTSFLILTSSLIFFIITNFGFWISSGFYSYDLFGLFECYVAAIPFYKGTLLGTIFYTPIFIGFYYYLQNKVLILKAKHLMY